MSKNYWKKGIYSVFLIRCFQSLHSPFSFASEHITHDTAMPCGPYVRCQQVTTHCVCVSPVANAQHASIHNRRRHAAPRMKTHRALESALWLGALAWHAHTHTHVHTKELRPHHGTDTLSVTLGHSHTHDSRFGEIMISLLSQCLIGTSVGHLPADCRNVMDRMGVATQLFKIRETMSPFAQP